MNNNKNKRKKISESNENCVGKSNKELKDADLKRKKQHEIYDDADHELDDFVDAPIQKPEGRGRRW